MFESLIQLIENHSNIIILRHQNPDLDAYGSQFGLYHALKTRYPDKIVLAVGDTNLLNTFQPLDEANDEDYRLALVIIVDTVSRQMLEGDRFELAKAVALIDHHRNEPDVRHDLAIIMPEASSTAEIITKFLIDSRWKISIKTAEALYMGIVADTGRFLYRSIGPETFRMAAKLLETGIDIQALYDRMYSESLAMKQLKSYFSNSISLTDHKVAYRRNDEAFLQKFNVDSHTVSRGLVNQMAGIEEIPVWANFTFDQKTGKILCELRSRRIPILAVAKMFGGGGHFQASGCTVDTWEDTDKVLAELDQLVEANHGQTDDLR
ncbi:MAG: bifunctional oligoribonuclease/PAP phosphatase NrnA [bacterium]